VLLSIHRHAVVGLAVHLLFLEQIYLAGVDWFRRSTLIDPRNSSVTASRLGNRLVDLADLRGSCLPRRESGSGGVNFLRNVGQS
jgi:hypothetical protein